MEPKPLKIFKVSKILYGVTILNWALSISVIFGAFNNGYDRERRIVILFIGVILFSLGCFMLNFITRYRLVISDTAFFYYVGRKEKKCIPLNEINEVLLTSRIIIIKHGRKKTIIPNYFSNVGQMLLLLNNYYPSTKE